MRAQQSECKTGHALTLMLKISMWHLEGQHSFITSYRCHDLKNIFAEKFGKKSAFVAQTTASFCKNLIKTLVFEKNANFCRKLSNLSENCNHNIGPCNYTEVIPLFSFRDVISAWFRRF
jgi:hypothetical protein